MTLELLTICTPTLGDSAGHLNRMMLDLRFFTELPFRQIVCDDGTHDDDMKHRQRVITEMNGAQWIENPGPLWGISYNFNHVLEQVKTPWAFLVEDGLRAAYGWLDAAVLAIDTVGNRMIQGHPVGMMGFPSIESWQLALAGALPTDLRWDQFIHRGVAEAYSAFWGSATHPNWNDGRWSWERLLPLVRSACLGEGANYWPSGGMDGFRDMVRQWDETHADLIESDLLGVAPLRVWPRCRRAVCQWFPGAFALINMDAWRQVGKFRDGCTFFEGHFGLRLAQRGWLSLCLPGPAFCHFGSMGFHAGSAERLGKMPRHHERCDGDDDRDIIFHDFGSNGPAHQTVYRRVVSEKFPDGKQREINEELATIDLGVPEGAA